MQKNPAPKLGPPGGTKFEGGAEVTRSSLAPLTNTMILTNVTLPLQIFSGGMGAAFYIHEYFPNANNNVK